MTILLTTVADSISKLSVSGLTIKDVNEIPTSINQRECPLLIPNPENYVSGAKIEVDSFGTGTNRAMSLHYNLNYLLIHSEVGVGRVHVLDAYSGMLTKATAFLDAVYGLSGLTGAVDFNALLGDPQITEVGAVAFHSIAISVQVQEFIN